MYLDLTTAAILSEKNMPASNQHKLFETTYDASIVLFKVLNNIFEFKK